MVFHAAVIRLVLRYYAYAELGPYHPLIQIMVNAVRLG